MHGCAMARAQRCGARLPRGRSQRDFTPAPRAQVEGVESGVKMIGGVLPTPEHKKPATKGCQRVADAP